MRLGPPDGFELGLVLGCPDGSELGSELGVLEGLALGFPLGISDGLALGMRLGPPDGFELGLVLGCPDGLELGSELGFELDRLWFVGALHFTSQFNLELSCLNLLQEIMMVKPPGWIRKYTGEIVAQHSLFKLGEAGFISAPHPGRMLFSPSRRRQPTSFLFKSRRCMKSAAEGIL